MEAGSRRFKESLFACPHKIALIILVLGTCSPCSLLKAQTLDEPVLLRAGFLSCYSEGADEDELAVRVPARGEEYRIRAKFHRAELASGRKAVDAFFKELFEGESSSVNRGPASALRFVAWMQIKDKAADLTSSAELYLLEEDETRVDELHKVGSSQKYFDFKASSWEYKLRVRCESGAGVYVIRIDSK